MGDDGISWDGLGSQGDLERNFGQPEFLQVTIGQNERSRKVIVSGSGAEISVLITFYYTKGQTVCKPGSVPRLSGDGHSSGTFVAERLARPTRAAARKARPAARSRAACRSYLVLLPVGFALPPPLPAARCALTAPFHPCRPPPRKAASSAVCFCGTFPGVAPAGRYPAPCLRGARTFLPPPSEPDKERPSDRLTGKIWDGAPRLSNRHRSETACRQIAIVRCVAPAR